MSLRTPSSEQYSQSLLNLQNVQAQIAQNTLRLTSGSQITSPGDDPTGAAAILDFGNSIQANTQFLAQATSANNVLQSASDALTSIISEANSLQTLAQDALGSASTAPGGMTTSAPQAQAALTNLLSLANTQFQGTYIFAGTNTTTQPFSVSASNSDGVQYSGNSGVSSLGLGVTATSTVATNIPGSTVFFGAGGQGSTSDLFQAVTDLYNGLNSNNTAQVQSASANLKTALDNLYQQQATIGGRQTGLSSLQTTISGINTSLQSAQSGIQSTDIAQTYTALTSEQTAQQAILSTMAKTNTNNLFNYLS
jgi:flagellar hook-associated protein 3 FlgL